mmetsp:Transcript_27184/g.49762  ORF Transcript_27184/g.49762 Transcript_27184/m.49762 type:complete len:128 (+) Transcript_27184:160-543(+)
MVARKTLHAMPQTKCIDGCWQKSRVLTRKTENVLKNTSCNSGDSMKNMQKSSASHMSWRAQTIYLRPSLRCSTCRQKMRSRKNPFQVGLDLWKLLECLAKERVGVVQVGANRSIAHGKTVACQKRLL